MNIQALETKENEETISYSCLEHAVTEWIQKDGKSVPIITTELEFKDHLGTCKVRMGFGRGNYKVPTGLYGVGNPDEKSEVLVTANYKLTFDLLRQELNDMNVWILVLDTDGINVWCAAGKGTFSSRELIYQIKKWNLKGWVKHRRLILPQLGAGSMEPHLVRKHTGFKIEYGPVRASDLKVYFSEGRTCSETMRTVTFTLKERAELTMVEVKNGLKYVLGIALVIYGLNYLGGTRGMEAFLLDWLPFVWAFFLGTVVFPMILPILPFHRFAMKGWSLGIAGSLIYLVAIGFSFEGTAAHLNTLGTVIGIQLIVSILGLVFTGSTTYTSYSGVDYETRQSVPYFIGIGIVSFLLMAVSRWI